MYCNKATRQWRAGTVSSRSVLPEFPPSTWKNGKRRAGTGGEGQGSPTVRGHRAHQQFGAEAWDLRGKASG